MQAEASSSGCEEKVHSRAVESPEAEARELYGATGFHEQLITSAWCPSSTADGANAVLEMIAAVVGAEAVMDEMDATDEAASSLASKEAFVAPAERMLEEAAGLLS